MAIAGIALPHCIGADALAAGASPHLLLPDTGAGVGSVDNLAVASIDCYVDHAGRTVASLCPEKEIARLGLGPRDMGATRSVVLGLAGTGNGLLECLADGIPIAPGR